MQPRLTVGILVLYAERLVCAIRNLGFLFQTTLAGVFAEPQEVAVLISHLSWDTDLVAVEVAGGLLSTFTVLVGGGSIGEPRTCVPHVPYVKTEDFVRATACWFLTIFQQFFFM